MDTTAARDLNSNCGSTCEPEHTGGLHPNLREAEAVRELFRRYAAGTTTLSQLAEWLNDQGFRTRNKRTLSNGGGDPANGPRLFTTYSVRWLLHNPFFTGKVRYNEEVFPGAHDGIVDERLFNEVQRKMKGARNSGTSRSSSHRVYLLKGLARCIYCGFPTWAQTTGGGYAFYREAKNSHAHAECPANGKSIRCSTIDEQVDALVKSLVLDPKWRKGILAKVSSLSEHERVVAERDRTNERLRRLGRAFIDGLVDEGEYLVQRKLLQDRLDSLVIPEAQAAFDAGKLLEDLPTLWEEASLAEQRKLLLTMLDAVYVDTLEEKSIVAIRPKPAFRPLFEVATTREGSGVVLYNENPPDQLSSPEDDSPCFWWRRGRPHLRFPYIPSRISSTMLSPKMAFMQ